MPAGNEQFSIRTYGRRKGHRLSPRKARLVDEALPRLRLDTATPFPAARLENLFTAPVTRTWLEIGFGAGEHLAWQANANRDAGIIGCEPFLNGVAALLGQVEDRGLENVRIHDGDAREVLDWLPEGSIERVFVLFPDPWPKARHAKRRIVTPETLAKLWRVMTPGTELRIASDIGPYVRTCLEAVAAHGGFAWQAESCRDWRTRPPDWPETRYERKALREGRNAGYLRFRRV